MDSAPENYRIATALEAWFAAHGRDYPWRRTRDPYAILVSEVMLQQTQIATVLERGYYTRWLERFPDFNTLAGAAESDILSAWEGLGYYRRARHLQRLAQIVVNVHGGVLPSDPAAIRDLPGIGPYTAGALASFAFGLPEPIVDGNVARVLSRLFDDATPIDSKAGSDTLWHRARGLVAVAADPRVFNSALMELGQTVCRSGKPACGDCPVRAFCRASDPAALPVRKVRTTLTEVTERVFFWQTQRGVLLQRETGGRRTGMWKLPALPDTVAPPPVLAKARYGITRYRVTLWVHEAPIAMEREMPPDCRWVPLSGLSTTPMPSPYRRALEAQLRGRSSGELL